MDKEINKIAAIILAAGEGKRIGQTKALINIDGQSFLAIIAARLKAIDCEPVLVVGGSNFEPVEQLARESGIDFVLNSNWESGQFSSVKAGMDCLDHQVAGVMITLVDHPFVKLETYKMLYTNFLTNPGRILIPEYDNKRGHPVIIPEFLKRDILNSSDNNTLRDIINKHRKNVEVVQVDDSGILKDVDTYSDFNEMQM